MSATSRARAARVVRAGLLAVALCAGAAPTLRAAPAERAAAEPAAAAGPTRADAIPPFSAPLADGGVFSDAQLRGHWSVVEFWGLWCDDSMADLSHARALASAIAQDRSLQFFTVHVEERYGRWTSAAAFARETGVRYPIALDPHRDISRGFGVSHTPTYVVVDPEGIIRARRGELRKDADPDGGVKALIKEIARLRGAT